MLGLKGKDAPAAEALTKALREAFADRQIGGGEDLSLEEVMLSMGCDRPGDAECMSQAGQALSVDRLIFGELHSVRGGDYRLEIFVLEVGGAQIEAQATTPLGPAALSSEQIEQTAIEIVNSLFPGGEDQTVVTGPAETPMIEDQVEEPLPYLEESPPLVWGHYRPRPKWKWIGFGVGVGLAVIGTTGAIATGVLVNKSNEDFEKAVADSLVDDVQANDLREVPGVDLCAAATRPLGDGVTNARAAEICSDGKKAETFNYVSFAVLGVGLATTIVFTTLLFVHRKDNTALRAMRERGFMFGAQPASRGQGVMFGTGARF